MKKICLVVLVLAFFLNSCEDVPEVPEKKNSVVVDNTVEETESEEDESKVEDEKNVADNGSEVIDEETNIVIEEEKIVSSYSIKPIDEEGILFYYFTESNILYKFKGYDKEEEQVYGIINYEDGTSEEVELTLNEFFLNEEDSSEIRMAWLIEDEYRDKEGVYHPKNYKYFTQKDGIVTQLSITLSYRNFMSYQQEENYGRFTTDNFELKTSGYDESVVSDLFLSDGRFIRFKQIWSICEIQGETETRRNGCYFNVLISGREGMNEGLYFMELGRTSVNYKYLKGRMYVR